MNSLVTQALTSNEQKKVNRDLRFISLLSQAAKVRHMRVVVGGGYAVDGALGEITRAHNDVDLQIYGQREDAMNIVAELIHEVGENDPFFADLPLMDHGRKEFFHELYAEKPGFGANIYYLHVVTDPSARDKVIVKNDGSHGEPHAFETHTVRLNGVAFEAQTAIVELVDKLYKRDRGDPRLLKHDQDIANLRLVTDADEAKKRIEQMKK